MREFRDKLLERLYGAMENGDVVHYAKEMIDGSFDKFDFIVDEIYVFNDDVEMETNIGFHRINVTDDVTYIPDEDTYYLVKEYYTIEIWF